MRINELTGIQKTILNIASDSLLGDFSCKYRDLLMDDFYEEALNQAVENGQFLPDGNVCSVYYIFRILLVAGFDVYELPK